MYLDHEDLHVVVPAISREEDEGAEHGLQGKQEEGLGLTWIHPDLDTDV